MRSPYDKKTAVLSRLLNVLAAAGAVAYAPSVDFSVQEGLHALAAADSAAYALVLAAAFLPGIGYFAKLWTIILVCHFLGIAVLFAAGAKGAGYIWILAGIVLSAVFGKKQITVASFALAAVELVVYWVALRLGRPGNGFTPVSFSVTAVNLLVVCFVLAVVIHEIQSNLERTSKEKQQLADRLAAELAESRSMRDRLEQNLVVEESLVRELNHRVSNNMQLVLSLMNLDDGSAASEGAIRRRIHALSAANEILLSDERETGAELRDIVRAVAETHRACPEACLTPKADGMSHILPPQTAVIAALCVSDLFAECAELRPVECAVCAAEEGARVSLRFAPDADADLIAETARKTAAGTMALAAAGSVLIRYLEPEGAAGSGIAADVRFG